MNSRLLHAAARGARIQTRYEYLDMFPRCIDWRTVSGMVFDPDNAVHPHEQRIHPDDAHLEYGPISTALREGVMKEGFPFTFSGSLAREAWIQECENPYVSQEWHLTFILFLAEVLADMGM